MVLFNANSFIFLQQQVWPYWHCIVSYWLVYSFTWITMKHLNLMWFYRASSLICGN